MNGHNRRRFTSAAALLIALVAAPGAMSWSADVALPNGQPDPSCEDLRLWLRADAGVRDADGRRPSDAGFSGTVASWSDQSERHFDLAAPSAQAPYYVMSAPGAGAPPTIAFGSGRTLARREDALHDQVNSTTLLVLKIEPSKEQGSTTFSTGELGGMWESLSFDRLGGSDAAQDYVHWTFPTTDREYQLTVPLQLATDGRFTLVTLRSANERSSLEVQNGLGDFFGANREFVPQGVSLLSNQCGPGYSLGGPALAGRLLGGPALAGRLLAAPGLGGQWLGGAALAGGGRGRLRGGGVLAGRRGRGQAQTQTGYDAQVAEVLVYNRDLPSADRRKLTAYLRSKYQLDVLDALFPAGAMLLQAEDFDGPWKIAAGLDPLGPTSLGHGPVVSPEVGEQGAGSREQGARSFLPGTLQVAPRSPLPATGQGMEGMRRTVLIPRPGDYSVWVRAANLESGGGIKTVVGGKALALTHTDAAMSLSWQLAGRTDLPAGETEIVIASEGPGRKEFDAVLISPTASTVADVEEICALARRLHQAPSPGQIAAVFADGRRIEGNLVSGFKGSGVDIARSQPGETSRPAAPGEPEGGDRAAGTFPPMGTSGEREARTPDATAQRNEPWWHGGSSPPSLPRPAVRLLLLPGVADKGPISPDEAPPADTLFEFHNGDRIRGSICGYAAATTVSGESVGAQLLVEPSQDLGKAAKKPISVQIDWLRRIVFDSSPSTASGAPPRRCPPRSLVCRDGRVIAFRALRFSGEGVSLITDQGLTRIGFRELAEAVLPPMDVWEAYYRQLAVVDPACDLGLVRLETRHGMVFTASSTGVRSFRAETEAAASTCLIQPAWSRTAIPLAWSAVCREWRAPACLVPLSQIAPQSAVQGGALDGGWRWQADHNVAGGELKSGGLQYFWGFGVHAPSELVFPLPDSAQAFRSGFGLDSSVGDFGSVVAKISIGDSAAAPLFQSKPLAGSRSAISTGDLVLGHHVPMVGDKPGARNLLLTVEDGGNAQGPVALAIGDHADWLEPTLVLDPVQLRADVQKFRPGAK